MHGQVNQSSIFSTTEVWAREYSGNECLYRDIAGRRVVGDFEGHGSISVQSELDVQMNGLRIASQQVEFEGGATLTTLDKGLVQVVMANDAPTLDWANAVEMDSVTSGCGWYVSHDPACHADSSHAPGPVGIPLPFFEGLVGRAQVILEQSVQVQKIDSFNVWDELALKSRHWKVRNVSEVFALDSRFPDGTPFLGRHVSHLNTARWHVELPEGNLGIRIRKLYDRFHGRQRVRVMVDGAPAGWWYLPEEDRANRWAWASFGVDPALTYGKTVLEIAIDPPPASPLWDVSRYEILAIMPR